MREEPERSARPSSPDRDPAEVEPTDNSSGAPPDPERVADAQDAATDAEASEEASGR